MGMKWIEANYYTSQLTTGHGDFNAKLKERKLIGTDRCICGEEDTSHHMLYDCVQWNEERSEYKSFLLQRGMSWPQEEAQLVNKKIFSGLAQFAASVLKRKEAEALEII